MNKQTVEDYANNLFHPFKETAIIKKSDVIKTLTKAIQQERKEIVEKFKNDLPMEGEKHKLTPFQETVNTYIKNRIEEIEEHLNNK